MIVYRGMIVNGRAVVRAEGRRRSRELRPVAVSELSCILPFAWGDTTLRSQTLALALISDATGDQTVARDWYRDFTHTVVAVWARDAGFEITQDGIKRIICAWRAAGVRRERARA